MTIRTVNADPACASTLARLDETITVARTEDNLLLLNMPRSIAELAEATKCHRRGGFLDSLRNLFSW
ncbi:hypothetical protein C3B44_11215 [Corynebacterium yudongzhengii]|uniref:Uncharacterized protein n=1 Tax=Corynebacterium yudongzhengii TaxID=2080740 RepID=A0A2U1T4C5_9CORY|nr:hypothetical protein [Corynebacterium yudongzhengii]AWB82828.1 hypothetical protein C3B44_11215 [Corynebacterium yudongzhengii]PWC00866.1 hypothetical protein DF222_10465 [Corynebacterium yudongzhengii]